MNSVEMYIVVEGQTEQTFVRNVLAPTMADNKIFLHPVLTGKPGYKGGNNFKRVSEDIGNFLKQRSNIYISTMFDYFRIDPDWPGQSEVRQRMQTRVSLTASQKAEILEKATADEIIQAFPAYNAGGRFIPYIEMHEFEALLFSDADILAEKTDIDVSYVRNILSVYDNPEEINDDPEKAPSKRLEALKNGYRKVANGKIISEAIGIQKIRKQCAHFDSWLRKLEHLRGH